MRGCPYVALGNPLFPETLRRLDRHRFAFFPKSPPQCWIVFSLRECDRVTCRFFYCFFAPSGMSGLDFVPSVCFSLDYIGPGRKPGPAKNQSNGQANWQAKVWNHFLHTNYLILCLPSIQLCVWGGPARRRRTHRRTHRRTRQRFFRNKSFIDLISWFSSHAVTREICIVRPGRSGGILIITCRYPLKQNLAK